MTIFDGAVLCALVPLGWAMCSGQAGSGPAAEVTRFAAATVTRARQDAARLASVEQPAGQGWSKSPVDPALMLRAFPALQLKEGLALRAYLFREGGNGNGVVWGLSEGAPFPDPAAQPGGELSLRRPPKPPGAFDDAMLAIDGDRTPWSYLCASLLGRQFQAFGALWHGVSWGTHEILGENPIVAQTGSKRPVPVGKPADWRWREPEPRDWNPSVIVGADRVVVVFYTYSALGQQTITRHTDTFRAGSYAYSTRTDEVAQGPGGFVF